MCCECWACARACVCEFVHICCMLYVYMWYVCCMCMQLQNELNTLRIWGRRRCKVFDENVDHLELQLV